VKTLQVLDAEKLTAEELAALEGIGFHVERHEDDAREMSSTLEPLRIVWDGPDA
jgi:hypothetical protein